MEWSPPVMRAIALIGGFVLLIVEREKRRSREKNKTKRGDRS
jgi:hypothetical protein